MMSVVNKGIIHGFTDHAIVQVMKTEKYYSKSHFQSITHVLLFFLVILYLRERCWFLRYLEQIYMNLIILYVCLHALSYLAV